MAKANLSEKDCVIDCSPKRALLAGYTKVKIMPECYAQIILISSVTGKTIQEIVDELLTYAIKKAVIKDGNKTLDIIGDCLRGEF